jgi:hypothetical protein
MKTAGGIFVVPVEIDGTMTLDFAVDSGAADVSVPADVFSALTRTGTVNDSDIIGEQNYVLADGSEANRSHSLLGRSNLAVWYRVSARSLLSRCGTCELPPDAAVIPEMKCSGVECSRLGIAVSAVKTLAIIAALLICLVPFVPHAAITQGRDEVTALNQRVIQLYNQARFSYNLCTTASGSGSRVTLF